MLTVFGKCGLFFKAMPKYSLIQKGDTCESGKQSKERLTVLLATSMTGKKLTPFVIGKSLKPRCFKTINKKIYRLLGGQIRRLG